MIRVDLARLDMGRNLIANPICRFAVQLTGVAPEIRLDYGTRGRVRSARSTRERRLLEETEKKSTTHILTWILQQFPARGRSSPTHPLSPRVPDVHRVTGCINAIIFFSSPFFFFFLVFYYYRYRVCFLVLERVCASRIAGPRQRESLKI